jgi:hypothetical protein
MRLLLGVVFQPDLLAVVLLAAVLLAFVVVRTKNSFGESSERLSKQAIAIASKCVGERCLIGRVT